MDSQKKKGVPILVRRVIVLKTGQFGGNEIHIWYVSYKGLKWPKQILLSEARENKSLNWLLKSISLKKICLKFIVELIQYRRYKI